jgi:peptidoglycan/xylan/chitin deacetylase (PgdA/CDA1 family)
MKGKYIFILLLIALLIFTVYKMMQFESHIRQERQVKLYIEDKSKPLLSRISDDELRKAAVTSDYYFTATGNYFKNLQVRYSEEGKLAYWDEIFLKGVNLGVAVPGKFPAEFSLSFNEYLEWIRLIGEMNANIIRLYTILPPEFYEAFAYYNLHHFDKPVYLMQGVWAEVPESENYYDPDFEYEFGKEMMDAIDVIHGNAVLKERPGKASGVYATDVSRYVAAILLGREWEPGSVFKTNRINNIDRYNGDFICMNGGNAMEAWLAKMMDFAVIYETQQYRSQHPVSFVNWLPLDPMYHNTEIIENKRVREYDNDLESIDFMKFHATELFYPGIYAAYHVYPYYPDFIYLQESYANPGGPDSAREVFYHYLEDLKDHNQGMPLVIAEYGLPSSRGNSHYSPFGFHQGGHSEARQAELSLLLTQDIVDASCGGAIYFEWIDEWFKHNWLVMDFEQPEDDRKLWHNMENPEQNFGIMALEDRRKIIDADLADWDKDAPSGRETDFAFDADASYFYIAGNLPDYDPARHRLYFAIDTYDRDKGDHKLPFSNEIFSNGFEFLVEVISADSAAILVDEPYSVYTDVYNDFVPVYASQENSNGIFTRQFMLTNRTRTSLTGEKTDSVVIDRSHLQYGKSSDPGFSNADWYYDGNSGMMEMRLDWHLLNVSSPAKRFVLDDKPGTRAIEYTSTDAFKIYAFITDKITNEVTRFPGNGPYSYTWETWEDPLYTQRLKPIYYILRDYFKDITIETVQHSSSIPREESFRITDYYNRKSGAISISFDNASFSQYEIAMPALAKYGFKSSFGVIPEWIDNSPRIIESEYDGLLKRLSVKEVKEIANEHSIAIQLLPGDKMDDNDLFRFSEKLGTEIQSMHAESSAFSGQASRALVFSRISPREKPVQKVFSDVEYLIAGSWFSQPELHSLIDARKGKWTIFVYHHFFDDVAEISHKPGKANTVALSTRKDLFELQLRLYRNSNYWIAPETEVFKYLKEKMVSQIRTERYQDMIFLKVVNNLDPEKFDAPLTVEYSSAAKIIRLKGSESDGTYTNKDGTFLFNVMPNKEVIIEIIE